VICEFCGLCITEFSNADGTVHTTAHEPNCPAQWFSDDDGRGVEDPDPTFEDYPGQRITGPDYDTRDREGDAFNLLRR
jgi:hypothetical protein